MAILNRQRLKNAAGECYAEVPRESGRLLGSQP